MMTATPKLLVSVRNQAEAMTACAGGATILDVKEPATGALGQAPISVIQEIATIAAKAGLPCSAAFGELHEPLAFASTAAKLSLRYAKLGLAHTWPLLEPERSPVTTLAAEWFARILEIESRWFARSPGWIAVVYADWKLAGAPPPKIILEAASLLEHRHGVSVCGVLVDTFSKTGPRLTQLNFADQLTWLRVESKTRKLLLALAGKIQIEDVNELVRISPDVIAIRSAACRDHDRRSVVCEQSVQELRAELLRCFAHSAIARVDASCVTR